MNEIQVCPNCNGEKKVYINKDRMRQCNHCMGTGQVDWIEAMMGKKEKVFMFECKECKNICRDQLEGKTYCFKCLVKIIDTINLKGR
jgi:hypothetical protein